MWQAHEGMGWWMLFGAIVTILFWTGVLALVVWVIAKLAGHEGSKSAAGGNHNPLDIARERYARGELTKEQFEQIKKDLA